MIKVTENGVPLAAIVSIEIRDWRLSDWYERPLPPRPEAIVHVIRNMRLSEEDVRTLRKDFLKNWPEIAEVLRVAAIFPKK